VTGGALGGGDGGFVGHVNWPRIDLARPVPYTPPAAQTGRRLPLEPSP
jgi:hypothetical protein